MSILGTAGTRFKFLSQGEDLNKCDGSGDESGAEYIYIPNFIALQECHLAAKWTDSIVGSR
jgi:hypothetical protein